MRLNQMAVAKRRRRKREASPDEFAKNAGVLKELQKDFPEVINPMLQLLIAANKSCQPRVDEFALDLSNIVYKYRRRLNSRLFKPPQGVEMDPDYPGNQTVRRQSLEQAVPLLKGLAGDLRQLDVFHLIRFANHYQSPLGLTKSVGLSGVFLEIEHASKVIAACQNAYSTAFPAAPKKRGRQPLPHIEATRELIELWKRYTNKSVPVSKTHQHQIITKSAEFVRLGLSLIDPDVSHANVVTAINNALSTRP